MRTLIVIALILVSCGTGFAVSTKNLNLVIALSPDIDTELAEQSYVVAMHIMDNAPVGSHLLWMSGAGTPGTITEFTKQDYPNRRVKARLENPHRSRIAQFLKKSAEAQNPESLAALDLPVIIRAIEGRLRGRTRLVLLGTPVWMSSSDAAFVLPGQEDVMLRFRLPSVGHLSSDLLLSPFGGATPKELLSGVDVLWWNPMPTACGPVSFRRQLECFWATYVSGFGASLAPIQEDRSAFFGSVFSSEIDTVASEYGKGSADVTMVTLGDLVAEAQSQSVVSTRKVVRRSLPAFTQLWLVDCSGSQASALETIARRISEERVASGEYFGLILFDSGKALFYSENKSPTEVAMAFRQAPNLGGMDHRGSFGAGLRVVKDLIQQRPSRGGVTVKIVSDVEPEIEATRPVEARYPALLRGILDAGHRIELIRCDKKLDTSTFLPSEVQVSDL